MPKWCRNALHFVVACVLFVGGVHRFQRDQISVHYAQLRAQGLLANRVKCMIDHTQHGLPERFLLFPL